MTAEKIREICRNRIELWIEELVKAHATPALLLGVGHDHARGEIALICVENLSDQELQEFLTFALVELHNRKKGAANVTALFPPVTPR
jgi:hypothetical protein